MADDPLVTIVLGGAPMGKKRHRSRVVIPKKGRPWVQTYPDPDGVAYEADLAAAGREAMAASGLIADPFDGPLTVFVEAFFPIPESWSNKKKVAAAAGEVFHTSKPDGDNVFKTVGDALNKICWVDDSQIVMSQIVKLYGGFPRLRISVWAWNDLPPVEPELL